MEEKRKIKIGFVEEAVYEAFQKLKHGQSDEKQLYEFLMRAINDLKKDPFIGIKIPRKLWPKDYVQTYHINNLWKYDLPNAWRLVYFIRGSDVEIVSVILEWFDHKNYERKFKY